MKDTWDLCNIFATSCDYVIIAKQKRKWYYHLIWGRAEVSGKAGNKGGSEGQVELSFRWSSGFFGVLGSICCSFWTSVVVWGFSPFNNNRRCWWRQKISGVHRICWQSWCGIKQKKELEMTSRVLSWATKIIELQLTSKGVNLGVLDMISLRCLFDIFGSHQHEKKKGASSYTSRWDYQGSEYG